MEFTPNQLLTGIRNAREQNFNATALDLLRRLISETRQDGSDFALEWEEILSHALALADEDVALEVTRRLVARFPENARYEFLMAERLSRVGRSDTALAVIAKLKSELSPNPALDHFMGTYSGHVGKIEEAKAHFRKAIAAKPDFGDAWALLASSGGLTEADAPELQNIVAARSDHALPGAAYALGSLYHNRGDHEKAWVYWSTANETLSDRNPYNVYAEISAQKAIFEADARIWDSPDPAEEKPPRVIFVVGPPRSGTTLTEQIIASAPGVTALGETMLSRTSTWPLSNLNAADLDALGAFSAPGATWLRFGAVYRHLASERSRNAEIVTDKGALLHLFVGALARMLPFAKFVWVKRDPRDIAFSAFRSYLTQGHRWRHNMTDAAKYLRAHDELMTGWQQKFPDRIYALDYQALASEPQTETGKLSRFLGLPEIDLSRADFGGANVPTASFAQIRGEITPKSVGGWKAYEKWIGPAFADS